MIALSSPLTRSARSIAASTSSAGETSPRRTRSAWAVASRVARSFGAAMRRTVRPRRAGGPARRGGLPSRAPVHGPHGLAGVATVWRVSGTTSRWCTRCTGPRPGTGGSLWNTLLALVPLALAVVLFRDGAGRGCVRCGGPGFVAWLLFLPNAPYVLTDSVHLLDDIRGSSNVAVYFGYLPVYGAFFVVGFGAYVLSLRLLHRFLVARRPDLPWLAIEAALHGCARSGIYLGRFVRLNSWDVFAAPSSVTATLDDLARRFPLGIMAMTFVVLAVGTFVANAVIDALVERSAQAATASSPTDRPAATASPPPWLAKCLVYLHLTAPCWRSQVQTDVTSRAGRRARCRATSSSTCRPPRACARGTRRSGRRGRATPARGRRPRHACRRGRERHVLVGDEPDVGVVDRRVAVVHAERLQPAVGHRVPVVDADDGREDVERGPERGDERCERGVHQRVRTGLDLGRPAVDRRRSPVAPAETTSPPTSACAASSVRIAVSVAAARFGASANAYTWPS